MVIWGASGVGKSEVASLLGKHCSLKCVDLDVVITERAGKSIKDIFRVEGESYFRDLEHQELSRLLNWAPGKGEITDLDFDILSLGGGCVTFERNREVLRQARVFTVWLKATAETISRRIERAIELAGGNDRPLVATDSKLHGTAHRAILASVLEKQKERDSSYSMAQCWLWTDWSDVEGVAQWFKWRFIDVAEQFFGSGRQLAFVVEKGSIVICEGSNATEDFQLTDSQVCQGWLNAVKIENILYRGEYRNFKSMEQAIASALEYSSGGGL